MIENVGQFYAAWEWPEDQEAAARLAFEAAMAKPRAMSCWRVKEPMNPPHRHHVVILMGENEHGFKLVKATIERFKGTPKTLDEDFVAGLRARRLRQYVEDAASGTVGQRVHVTRDMPRTMDRTGRMYPADEGDR